MTNAVNSVPVARIIVFVLLLAGCAPGPVFKREPIPEDRAAVYIYRPIHRPIRLVSMAGYVAVGVGHAETVPLWVGGYAVVMTPPGAHELSFTPSGLPLPTLKRRLTVKAGQDYFVRVTSVIPRGSDRATDRKTWVELVPRPQALREIAELNLTVDTGGQAVAGK